MHSFLSAVGFSALKNNIELDKILNDAVENPNRMQICKDAYGNEFAELTKEYGDSFGLKVCGRYTEEDKFQIDYYYPYFNGKGITTEEKVDIERHAGNESYAGICDELKAGVTLIFYINNTAEYLDEYQHSENCLNNATVTLSGLSTYGRIVLPIEKKKREDSEKQSQFRNHLMAAAREGDEEAIESLTLEDMDTYTMLSRRVVNEDVLSIVETSFMPYGIESDQYAIIGEILDCYTMLNKETQEEIYSLTVNTNDMIFDICINRKDLLGEPMIGRRFKGSIWMQGKINFHEI